MLALPLEELGLSLSVESHSPTARRLRFGLSQDHPAEGLLQKIENRLWDEPGVEEVRAERRTGRILVQYAAGAPLLDHLVANPQPCRKQEARLRVVPQADGPPPSLPAGGVREARPADATPWHALAVQEVLERLGSTPAGLDVAEASRRHRQWGPNAYEAVAPRSKLEILADQLSNLPTALLLGSSAVSLVLGDVADAVAIDSVVALNAGIGYRIERTNEELLATWRKLESGEARVLREGAVRILPSIELVPGDILLCQAGDIVPADARAIDTHRLTCNEAPLTGESEPQRKWAAPVAASTSLPERSSMLYAGTSIVSGRGRAVITAIGRQTQMAEVRSLIERARAPRAPLQRRMEEVARRGTILSLGAGGLTAAAGIVRGQPLGAVLRSGIALAVAAIPEGLPVVVTAALVRSMSRLREMGMVVRRMAAVEALGGVTVVCADKTGTLTCNDMQLEVLEIDGATIDPATVRAAAGWPSPVDPAALALTAAVLNSDIEVHNGLGRVEVVGSSTERAFVAVAEAAGLTVDALRARFPRKFLRERSESAHYVVSFHEAPEGDAVAFLKGAPEQVLSMCGSHLGRSLDDEGRRRVLGRNDALASQGLRILALAWQTLPNGSTEAPQEGYDFIGLAALRDPLRARAEEAVGDATRASIRTLILTGDQRATAEAVARAVGLRGEARDGAEVVRLLDGHANPGSALAPISVLSRVTPADKVKIVRALREAGEIVAMVGDGINDAPALKVADVGIAVGPRASDVARQTADVVLATEDLRSILAAVGEGRIVQDNLRRATAYLFATNLSEVALVVAGALLGLEMLSPMQLLWINLLTDTLPALAIAFEPGEPHVLDRPPAPPDQPILGPEEWRRSIRHGLVLAGLGGLAYAVGGPAAAFAALPAAQLAYAAICRAPGTPHHDGFVPLVGGAAALHLAALTVPPLRALLGVAPPSAASLIGYALGLAAPLFAAAFGGEDIVVKGEAYARANSSPLKEACNEA